MTGIWCLCVQPHCFFFDLRFACELKLYRCRVWNTSFQSNKLISLHHNISIQHTYETDLVFYFISFFPRIYENWQSLLRIMMTDVECWTAFHYRDFIIYLAIYWYRFSLKRWCDSQAVKCAVVFCPQIFVEEINTLNVHILLST